MHTMPEKERTPLCEPNLLADTVHSVHPWPDKAFLYHGSPHEEM